MEAALLALLLAAARAANTSDVALVLRGLSSPRRYERFDGATVTSANWRATHCELRRRLIDPFGADAFLHTWAGDEAAAVVAAYAPVASRVEAQVDFRPHYDRLITTDPCGRVAADAAAAT